jgi:hypothetical protein
VVLRSLSRKRIPGPEPHHCDIPEPEPHQMMRQKNNGFVENGARLVEKHERMIIKNIRFKEGKKSFKRLIFNNLKYRIH